MPQCQQPKFKELEKIKQIKRKMGTEKSMRSRQWKELNKTHPNKKTK